MSNKELSLWQPFGGLEDWFMDDLRPSFPALRTDLAVDVFEEDGNIIAKMGLPGVTESEIEVSIEDNLLHISGAREEEKETDTKNYYSKEIRRGAFSRVVRLPKAVEATDAQAAYDDGVLTVTMPVDQGQSDSMVKVPLTK